MTKQIICIGFSSDGRTTHVAKALIDSMEDANNVICEFANEMQVIGEKLKKTSEEVKFGFEDMVIAIKAQQTAEDCELLPIFPERKGKPFKHSNKHFKSKINEQNNHKSNYSKKHRQQVRFYTPRREPKFDRERIKGTDI